MCTLVHTLFNCALIIFTDNQFGVTTCTHSSFSIKTCTNLDLTLYFAIIYLESCSKDVQNMCIFTAAYSNWCNGHYRTMQWHRASWFFPLESRIGSGKCTLLCEVSGWDTYVTVTIVNQLTYFTHLSLPLSSVWYHFSGTLPAMHTVRSENYRMKEIEWLWIWMCVFIE